jgi:putative ABC transport system ATP-binding protein
LDLDNQKHKLPSQLSIGQQQRVSIARALINEPKLLLADEPTSSLDDENAFKVADLLEKLSKEYNAALVIVTHDSRLKNKFSNQINLN